MLQITDKATDHLKSVLTELDLDGDACFRLGITQEGVKLAVDRERPGDVAIKDGDKMLMVIDALSSDHFEGHTMDFNEDTKQLVFS